MTTAKERRKNIEEREALFAHIEKVARKAGSAEKAVAALTGYDLIIASSIIQEVYHLSNADMIKLLGW